MNTESLLNTSVDDAKISMQAIVSHDPLEALQISTSVIKKLHSIPGRVALKRVMFLMARQALKKLEGELQK